MLMSATIFRTFSALLSNREGLRDAFAASAARAAKLGIDLIQLHARLVRLRREDNARIRFLTFKEEALIRSIIRKRCPTHEPDFVAAIETGRHFRHTNKSS